MSVSVRASVDAGVFPIVVPAIENLFFFLTWGLLLVDSYFRTKEAYFKNKLGERDLLKVSPPQCGKYSARGVSVSVSVGAFVHAGVFPIVVHAIENHFFF